MIEDYETNPNLILLRLADETITLHGPERIWSLARFLRPFTMNSFDGGDIKKTFRIRETSSGFVLKSSNTSKPILRAESSGDLLLLFDRILIDTFFSLVPRPTVLVHAAVFYREEEIYVFPGRGGAGKTTLAEYLLGETDWTFITDEVLAVDPSAGVVYPFPHPLNFKTVPSSTTVDLLEVRDSGGSKFTYGITPGQRSVSHPLEFRTLNVFELNRKRDIEPRIESLTPGAGLQRLFFHSTKPNSPEDRFRRIMTLKDHDPRCFRLHYGNCSVISPNELIRRTDR
jgi:hypothetical protein